MFKAKKKRRRKKIGWADAFCYCVLAAGAGVFFGTLSWAFGVQMPIGANPEPLAKEFRGAN